MHEVGLAQELVEKACVQANGARVSRIFVEVEAFACIVPEALENGFRLCGEGTVLEEAQIEIKVIPVIGKCQVCHAETKMNQPVTRCACGSIELSYEFGDRITLTHLECNQRESMDCKDE